ncbi:threonine aldolase family protein [Acuticoccus sp.]|uniref:threonine aldolase family protein n=1 Tax=Acuticoccus sp. TaxID=1904378 RepID=UPI003B51B4E6
MTTFASDNWAGASDRVMAALALANEGTAPGYGADEWTARARSLIADLFERDVTVFFVATGSAANSLALAATSRPGGVVFCHADAHIARDEAGAPVLFAPQIIDPVDGPGGRIDPDLLAARVAAYLPGNVHDGRPAALSLTNVTELGQCYTPDEVARLAEIARSRGMAVHVDGARFMNALAYLGVSAADLTWRSGVDVLSLGLTKTGGWCAEAVVLFDPSLAEDTAYRHKQSAMLFSKNRFAAAQFCALLEGGHAAELAGHANRMAARLADRLAEAGAPPVMPPQSNEVFAFLTPNAAARLSEAGIGAYAWAARSRHLPAAPAPDAALHRFVASFRTTEADIDAVATALGLPAAA